MLEANGYGIRIDGTDGRAGMAALVIEDHFSLAELPMHLSKLLPEYARPVFLRIREQMDITATFKQKKHDLASQGYDPTTTTDPIYFYHPEQNCYVPVDSKLYLCIQSGKIRV